MDFKCLTTKQHLQCNVVHSKYITNIMVEDEIEISCFTFLGAKYTKKIVLNKRIHDVRNLQQIPQDY